MTETARTRQLANDRASDLWITCPACGDLNEWDMRWCECGKWLRLTGPTATDLHSRRMQALHYPPHPAEALTPDKEKD